MVLSTVNALIKMQNYIQKIFYPYDTYVHMVRILLIDYLVNIKQNRVEPTRLEIHFSTF